MSDTTPILDCRDHQTIQILPTQPTPSSPSPHPLQNPHMIIPPSLLSHIQTASTHILASRTVAFPTETVYGLGASSLDPTATSLIYRIKNRPSDNPLIIHISSLFMLSRLIPPSPTYAISKLYMGLITAFWPGPLTLLFPNPNPPPYPAPSTLAIRLPSHPLALALIHHSDTPISAPSANSSGRPSPTKAIHVYNDLRGKEGLGCILDGGDCGVGVESTVVDGLGWKEGGGGGIDVLRPGGLGVEGIVKVLEEIDGGEGKTEVRVGGKVWKRNAVASSSKLPPPSSISSIRAALPGTVGSEKQGPSTPGMKYRHYSPRIPVVLLLPSNTFPKPPSFSSQHDHAPSKVVRILATGLRKGKERERKPRIGLLHYNASPLHDSLIHDAELRDLIDITAISLGEDATSAAQRIFAGLLALEGRRSSESAGDVRKSSESAGDADDSTEELDGEGVDLILVEGCSDDGLGLAVMERVGKAVGGGGRVGDLDIGEVSGSIESGRFWVQV